MPENKTDNLEQITESKKNKYNYKLILLILLLIIQFAVPVYMIFDNEAIYFKGTEIKLRVEQYDPYDYARGNYLNLTAISTSINYNELPKTIQDEILKRVVSSYADFNNYYIYCYVTFKKDNNGMDIIDKVTTEKPTNTRTYLKAHINPYESDLKTAKVDYEINEIFINENYAAKSQELMMNLPKGEIVYVALKVLDGNYIIESLHVGDKTIYEYIDALEKNRSAK